jgi:hypothetical protein
VKVHLNDNAKPIGTQENGKLSNNKTQYKIIMLQCGIVPVPQKLGCNNQHLKSKLSATREL